MVTCIYVLYKMHLSVTIYTNFNGTLILEGIYFKSNITIIFVCNTVNNVLFCVPYF